MERICAVGVESAYGRKKVLKGVDLSADAGECVGLIGANGCGKSTLLAILAGLRRADSGRIVLEGHTVFDGSAPGGRRQKEKLFARYTGYVPQESSLIGELSVRDNLLLWYGDRELLKHELREGILHRLGLEEICSERVNRLSGGMKKRVAIGCALAGHPGVLLLDEPQAALDLPGKAEIRRCLEAFKKAGGAVILATHDEGDLDICDRLCVLEDGRSREIDRTLRGDGLMRQMQHGL